MPTRAELNRAVAEVKAEVTDRVTADLKRARQMRKAGIIDAYAEDQMIRTAGQPAQPLDPAQFPHANRLKI